MTNETIYDEVVTDIIGSLDEYFSSDEYYQVYYEMLSAVEDYYVNDLQDDLRNVIDVIDSCNVRTNKADIKFILDYYRRYLDM